MQAIQVTGQTHTNKILEAVAEKLNTISGNSYVQLSLVLSIIGLVSWFVAFKTTTENIMAQLGSENNAIKLEIKELRQELPSRDWLELKFQNLEAQFGASKKSGK